MVVCDKHLSHTCWFSKTMNDYKQNQPYNILAPIDMASVTNMVVLNTRTTIGFHSSHVNHWKFPLPTHNSISLHLTTY